MNPKEALQQIRALFEDMPQVAQPQAPVAQPAEPAVPEVTKVEMAEYSLADGTKVMISALEIGGKVEMADGTPAPQGEHQLMDGTSIHNINGFCGFNSNHYVSCTFDKSSSFCT